MFNSSQSTRVAAVAAPSHSAPLRFLASAKYTSWRHTQMYHAGDYSKPKGIAEQICLLLLHRMCQVRLPSLSFGGSARFESELLGYGLVAVDLLTRYYEGQMINIDDDEEETEEPEVNITEAAEKIEMPPLSKSMDEDLAEAAKEVETPYGQNLRTREEPQMKLLWTQIFCRSMQSMTTMRLRRPCRTPRCLQAASSV